MLECTEQRPTFAYVCAHNYRLCVCMDVIRNTLDHSLIFLCESVSLWSSHNSPTLISPSGNYQTEHMELFHNELHIHLCQSDSVTFVFGLCAS